MFLRSVKVSDRKGGSYEYVRLVESYREGGKSKQRVVCNLGPKDLLAAHLDSLVTLLGGSRQPNALEDLRDVEASNWGPLLVASHLWRELGLESAIDRLAGREVDEAALAERFRAWLELDRELAAQAGVAPTVHG